MDNLQKITEACIKANPDLLEQTGFEEVDLKREIQLADVFMATGLRTTGKENVVEMICGQMTRWLKSWDMKEPLENQSQETIDLIADVIK